MKKHGFRIVWSSNGGLDGDRFEEGIVNAPDFRKACEIVVKHSKEFPHGVVKKLEKIDA